MDELSAIFANDLTAAVFCIGSTAFLLLYAAGLVLSWRWNRSAGRASLIRRYVILGLGAAFAAILAATGVASGVHSANVTMTSAAQQTGTAISISPQEPSRSGGMRLSPVQKFEDYTFVFSNRD